MYIYRKWPNRITIISFTKHESGHRLYFHVITSRCALTPTSSHNPVTLSILDECTGNKHVTVFFDQKPGRRCLKIRGFLSYFMLCVAFFVHKLRKYNRVPKVLGKYMFNLWCFSSNKKPPLEVLTGRCRHQFSRNPTLSSV